MSMSSYDEGNAWGAPPPEPEVEIDAAGVVEKERLVKEIITMQEGLKALLDRVTDVQEESAKLKAGNETLQTYIDNLTRNNAMAAGAGR
ncbi:hypothetical protein MNV49_002637 [Pseudohyphozyma bogoriensis]|nr:hypothetical protein MNV49_002637 [Pseudohyphozyma bogoriensis]